MILLRLFMTIDMFCVVIMIINKCRFRFCVLGHVRREVLDGFHVRRHVGRQARDLPLNVLLAIDPLHDAVLF